MVKYRKGREKIGPFSQEVALFIRTGEGFGISAKFVTFKGKERLDLRLYNRNHEGEWRPTKTGLVINSSQAVEFAEGLMQEVLEHTQNKEDAV